ncbi:MAG: peptidylprolyl isomerase [Burkholderiales bacterium]|nr:peptidylprolyl isomerase [Burkholderiales bacterium]
MSAVRESVPEQHPCVVRINEVPIASEAIEAEGRHHQDEPDPYASASRALAIRELLRQRAVELGLIEETGTLDDASVDMLLERELVVPTPTRAECERYYEVHSTRFRRNDIVYASHILFAVTGSAPLALIRQKAEETLREVRAAPDTFEALAKKYSNCPSGAVGGSLGQLLRGDSVPEFEVALFGAAQTGVLPNLVNSRFGFHVVRIERRVDGEAIPFESVEKDIAQFLEARVRSKAMQQYISILASQARIEGVDLGAADGPLVQ